VKGSALIVSCLLAVSTHAAIVQFQDLNTIINPELATTFSSLPRGLYYDSSISIDGFEITQAGSTVPYIYTGGNPGRTGTGRAWYPNGGSAGYTEIALTSGAEFGDLSLAVGSGNFYYPYLAYELLNNGVSIQSGTIEGHQAPYHWLSVLGGGFDTIRLRDGNSINIAIGDDSTNALAIDSIYMRNNVSVAETTSLLLLGIGLMAMSLRRKPKAA